MNTLDAGDLNFCGRDGRGDISVVREFMSRLGGNGQTFIQDSIMRVGAVSFVPSLNASGRQMRLGITIGFIECF